MESGIYMLTCKISKHRYIGQSQNITRRLWEHKSQRNAPRLPISRAIKKYGWENFECEVLEYCPAEELNEKEIYYIELLKPEYNVSKGGEQGMRGYHHSPETKEKLKVAATKQWQGKTPEEKAYVITHQLTHHSKKGDTLTDSAKEKLREVNLGKKQSEETKTKRSIKMKVSMLGNQNGNKTVRCVETGEIFQSIKCAATDKSINAHEITAVLRGWRNRKTAGGYHWEYHNSVETNRDECSDVGEKNELLLEVHGNLNG